MVNKKGQSGNPAKRAEQAKPAKSEKGVAIYHEMRADEEAGSVASAVDRAGVSPRERSGGRRAGDE